MKLLLAHEADPKHVDRSGKGPLVYAAGKGFASIAEMLLDAGVDVNARYGNDLTALMWAAGHGNDVPETEGLETVNLLLQRGARIGDADNRGRTALMIAAERGHGRIAARLMAVGADRTRRDNDGLTALDLARDAGVRRAIAEATPGAD